MKELSIKEKAKAYDEAIKRLEDIKTGKCQKTFMFTEGLFDYIFPELKESEDERIKKELIQNLKERFGTHGSMGVMLDMPRVIAWLEKQGEQKPNPYSGTSFDYNGHTWGMCARDGGVEILVDRKLYTSISADKSKVDKTLILRPFKLLAGHRYFCIKTPVWTDHYYQVGKMYESINDDKIVDDLGKEHTFSDKINCPPQYWFCEVAEPVQEINIGPKPQPSKEWSKEDENNILFLTSIIEECFKDKEKITLCSDTVCAHFTKKDVIDRLKSLRPQNHWKPSDEQMSALKEQCVYKKSTVAGEVLCELFHDLEKLREE